MPVRIGLQHIHLWNESLEKQVLAYEQEEQPQGQIVFYGSSSFTRWSTRYGMTPLREVLRGASGAPCCVNRGFGSSCSEHQLYYYPRMVRPLAPKALVYTSFGNGTLYGYSNEEIWELAQRVVAYAMTDFPGVHIYLCGTWRTPKDSDKMLYNKAVYNEWQRKFVQDNAGCFFVDMESYAPIAGRDDIYVADGVHFNQDGYHLFADFYRGVLKDELAQF